jgi:hypothetical protein
MDEITLDGDTMKLRSSDGRVLDTQRAGALARAYAVYAAADASFNVTDVPLRVFRFADKVWVLPWTAAGVTAAIAAIWPEPQARAEGCWEAVIDELPRDWRKLLGDGLRPQGPALLVAPVSALPAWQIRREGSDSHFVGEHAYPYLDALIAGWFRHKAATAGPALAAAIGSFRKDTNADDWAETRADIGRLLRRHDDAALAQELVRLFGAGVAPIARDGARRWLARIDELLKS